MEKWEAEQRIRSFVLYYNKYLKNADAFILPKWYLDARDELSQDECQKIWVEEQVRINEKETSN